VFTGKPFHIALARPSGSFEFTYAELGLGTTSVTGDMEMAFEDTWAHFCIHHFNRDGLVRERPGSPNGSQLDGDRRRFFIRRSGANRAWARLEQSSWPP
jgi:hypothetical protein